MSSAAERRISVEEYLARERIAEQKSEYYDGEVFAMAGASPAHNAIVSNLLRELGLALKKTNCQVFPSDLRTRLPSGLYSYPDVIIVCGKPEYAREDAHTLVNPTVAIEVLSKRTIEYDTGRKFRWYQQTPSIQEIGFVAQDEPRFQVYQRSGSNWLYDEAASVEQSIRLRTGDVSLPMVEVYRNVEFPAAVGSMDHAGKPR